jgi:hypothetical protein
MRSKGMASFPSQKPCDFKQDMHRMERVKNEAKNQKF